MLLLADATDEPWRCTSGMVRDRSKHPVMPLLVAWFLGLHTAQGTDEEEPGQAQAMWHFSSLLGSSLKEKESWC